MDAADVRPLGPAHRAHARSAVAVFAVVVIAGLEVAVPFLDQSMRPVMQERDVVVRLDSQPGTSLQRMDEITAQAVEELRSLPGIDDVGATSVVPCNPIRS